MSVNTTADAMAMSCAFAFSTGAAAAMALPPQIEVPTLMKVEGVLRQAELFAQPHAEPEAECDSGAGVDDALCAPPRSTWVRFMPNPHPDDRRAQQRRGQPGEVIASNGFPHATEKMTPQMTATPGA